MFILTMIEVVDMKKIFLILVSLFLIVSGCTENNPNQVNQETAILKLKEAGCWWNTSEERVKVDFKDPNWIISARGCAGECKINKFTGEMNIDNDPMCAGAIVEGDSQELQQNSNNQPKLEVAQVNNVKQFDITASNFAYNINEITVKKGDLVKIKLSIESGFHDFVIDEFNAKTKKIRNGEVDSVEFLVDKEGRFEYYCSIGSHRSMGMKGTLIVEP